MNMTVAKLTKLKACKDGIQYFKEHKFKTVEQAISEILKTNHEQRLDWSNWLISHSLSKMDCIRYAIYATEQVIGIFEKEYKRPRESIQAAKRYIKNPTKENKDKCKVAACASWVVSYIVKAAAATSWTAFRDEDNTANGAAKAASWAVLVAHAALVDKNKMFEKIIKYGLKLLKETK
jgi:hypothetical protein